MEQYIDAGRLNKRVTLQKRGEDPAVWEDICTVWAAINNAGSREYWEARAAHGELTHKVTIRYRKGVDTEMRVLYGDRAFHIIAPPVDFDMRHKYLILKCREASAMYAPHTVTVYNVREDPVTFEMSVSITVLAGVLLEGMDGARAAVNGLRPGGKATLKVPLSVPARDALTGAARRWAAPREYAQAEDRGELWTLDPNRDFFVKGKVVVESGDFQEIHATHDGCWRVTSLEIADTGAKSLWHIEAGGA